MLKEDPHIQKVGVYQSVGMTEQENGITMGMVCSDETTMQLSNITLLKGRMPQAADELLVERGLWVIMTMVWLNSILVRFKSHSTSALVLESRFPVGSSALIYECITNN